MLCRLCPGRTPHEFGLPNSKYRAAYNYDRSVVLQTFIKHVLIPQIFSALVLQSVQIALILIMTESFRAIHLTGDDKL
jgi:hypothetical protein